MSTPHPAAVAGTDATAATPSSGKKLRFDIDERQPKLRSAMKSTASSDSKGGSPTAPFAVSDFADVSRAGSEHAASSSQAAGRRFSETGDVLHVTLNTAPAEIIEAAASPLAPTSSEAARLCMESAVASALADIGVRANRDGPADGALATFRPLLVRTAALLMAQKPPHPERFLVDHFHSKQLSASGAGLNARASQSGGSGSISNNASLHGGTAGDSATGAGTGESDADGAGDLDSSAGGVASGRGGTGTGVKSGTTSQPIVFAPVGDTVAQRLAFAAPTGVSRPLIERMAKLLLDMKPDDPETFLWTKLDSRSFSEEVAATTTMAYTADGFPLMPPEDPTQAALLREVPSGSVGYNVAANVIPLLFAKKPDNPFNYLFLHLTSRARSSVAGSVRSSNNRQRFGEEDNTSCTSRDMGDDFDDDADPEDLEDALISATKDDLTTEQDAAVSSFLSHLQRKAPVGYASTQGASRRRLPSSSSANSLCAGAARRSLRSSMTSFGDCGGGGAARRSSVAHHHNHQNPQMHRDVSSASLTGNASCSSKRVCISEDHNVNSGGSPNHEPPLTYYSQSGGSSHAASTSGVAVGVTGNGNNFVPSFYAAAPGDSSPDYSTVAGELELLREELNVLKLRGAMRLERVGYEVDVLRQEKEHLTRLVALDRGEHASRALQAACHALACAESHLQVLETKQQYLLKEMAPRHLRTMTALVQQQQQHHGVSSSLSRTGGSQGRIRSSTGSPLAVSSHSTEAAFAVPSELDILRKKVELIMMEQARQRAVSGLPA